MFDTFRGAVDATPDGETQAEHCLQQVQTRSKRWTNALVRVEEIRAIVIPRSQAENLL